MSRVGFREILSLAKDRSAAIPAFNCYNQETVMGVVQAAEEYRSPVILQGYSRLFDSDSGYYLAALVRAAAERASVPICFHMDHGAGKPEVIRALRWGCTGIMIDMSRFALEDNLKATKEIVELCSHGGVATEGELGRVGMAKDGISASYTDVKEAAYFCRETGIAALAPQVGTAHGHYRDTPKLAVARIQELAEATGIPLVLHGGSGIPNDQISASIRAGIKKINFGTDVCCAFLNQIFATSRELIAVDLFMCEAVTEVARFAGDKMKLLGSAGLA